MNSYLIMTALITAVSHVLTQEYEFKVPDKNAKYNFRGVSHTIDAHKVQDRNKMKQWVSIGYPYFRGAFTFIGSNKAYLKLQMLDSSQIDALVATAKRMYKDESITPAQFSLPPLQTISCETQIDHDGVYYTLRGEANYTNHTINLQFTNMSNEMKKATETYMKTASTAKWLCKIIFKMRYVDTFDKEIAVPHIVKDEAQQKKF